MLALASPKTDRPDIITAKIKAFSSDLLLLFISLMKVDTEWKVVDMEDSPTK